METNLFLQRERVKKPGTLKKWIRRLLVVILILVTAVWAAGTWSKASLMKRYPPPGKLVEAGGFRLHLYCTGQGSPTVLLEAGQDDFSIMWSQVQPVITRETQVCSYDRAGLGWSEPSPNPRTSENKIKELHTLLENAGVKGPFILVGHSIGGAFVRLYAHNYPEEVAGMVLVDAAHEELFLRVPAWRKAIQLKIDFFRTLAPVSSFGLLAFAPDRIPNRGLPEAALAQYRAVSVSTRYYQTGVLENEAFEPNLAEIRAADITSFGSLPLIVLSRGYWDPMPGLTVEENHAAWSAWQEMQAELVLLSANGRQQIAAHSEHSIHLQQPELVIDAIREIVEAVQK